MRPPLPILWAVVCVIAAIVAVSDFAVGADGSAPPQPIAGASQVADAGTAAQDDRPLSEWIAETFARAPALMFGLIAVIAAPLFAIAGLMLRPSPKSAQEGATRVVRRSSNASREPRLNASADEGFAWPAKAWVEIEGAPGGRHEIGLGMVRIGRDDDNEIRLPAKTVHRTHAVVHRTSDADFVVTDVSGTGGNGVLLNGNRVSEARLNHGDRIELGEVALRFISRPS